MNSSLDEQAFVWALLQRPEFMRQFCGSWQPQWLRDASLVPIVTAAFKFFEEYEMPPSLPTLRKIFQDDDAALYELRHKKTLQEIEDLEPDSSYLAYTLKKARDLAIVRSFEALLMTAPLNEAKEELDGQKLLRLTSDWTEKFVYAKQEETLNISQAIDQLLNTGEFKQRNTSIPSGLDVLDRWTVGGIRPGQLGIFLAPTGHGKSTILLNLAYRAALIEEVPTWFVTNELTMMVQAERFLARMTGVSKDAIHNDPMVAYDSSKLDPLWHTHRLHEKLMLTSLYSCPTKEIEASLLRRATIEGWKPKLIVLDYMERLIPNHRHAGDGEWVTMQKVARDLVELAKKHDCAIWTAAQVNRSGMQKDVELTLDMAQSSVRHLDEADYVFGLQKVQLPGQADGVEAFKMKTLKNRHGRQSHKHHYLEVDLDKMLIRNIEIAVAELNTETESQPSPKPRARKRGLNSG